MRGRSFTCTTRSTHPAAGTAPTRGCARSSSRSFVKYNVSVVFGAHDNIYERTKPQGGITYFVVGSSGRVRQGDIDRNSGLTASGFDTDLAFLAAEIIGDQMHFNAISRTGQTVDSGALSRRK